MDHRVTTAAVGLAVSLLISVAVWIYLDTALLFFFLPFVPFLFRQGRGDQGQAPERESGSTVRSCPVCEFRTDNPDFDYCPRDGHRLEREP